MQKDGTYKLKEPNLIGQIGEIIACSILEREFAKPQHSILRSNTYPYATNMCFNCKLKYPKTVDVPEEGKFALVEWMVGPDVELIHPEYRILIEVKTTLRDDFKISGSGNRRYFVKQMDNWKKKYPQAKFFVLYLSLADFPHIDYRLEEV